MICFSVDGKYLISRCDTLTVIWNTRTWKEIITIEEKIGIVLSSHRRVHALLHDGLYKPFQPSVLKEFFYEEEEVVEEAEDKDKEVNLSRKIH